jgi:hypothetical protein
MTSFSQNDHLKSYQEFVSYFEIQIDYLKQENLYHDGDSKYENNSISFQNSFSIELNVISFSLNEKDNFFSDLDCSIIKHEDSKDSEQSSIIEIPKDNDPLNSEDAYYPEKELIYLEEKKSFPPIESFRPKKIIEKNVRLQIKKNPLIVRSLNHKRNLFKKKYFQKFKYKNRLLNVNSIKLDLFNLQKIKKIFDFIKKSKKNTENKVRYEKIKKNLKIIKSIIRKRFNIINNYLNIYKKMKLEIPDDFYEIFYGNKDKLKELNKRKSIAVKMIKLRTRKKFYVYRIFKSKLIPNILYHII